MAPVPVRTTARAEDTAAKRAVSASQKSRLMALALPSARRSSATPSRSLTSITSPAPSDALPHHARPHRLGWAHGRGAWHAQLRWPARLGLWPGAAARALAAPDEAG